MTQTLRPACVIFVVLSVLTGIAYPLATTEMARLLFPSEAAGSLVKLDGRIVGSASIGQSFTDPKYFWGRPSATGDKPYDASASSGSNLAPTNPALVEAVAKRIAALRAAEPGNGDPIPADLVTASASGLDPHVSVASARWQAPRVARLRGLPKNVVEELITRHTEQRQLGFLGEPRVNVLALNLALDAAARK